MEEVYLSYATALYSLLDEGQKKDYQKALQEVKEDFSSQPEFLSLLSSYRVEQKEKEELLKKIYSPLGLTYLVPFLSLLCKRHRIHHFSEVEQRFSSLVDEGNNVLRGVAYSSEKLSEEQLTSIEASLKKKTSSEVRLTNIVDPSLLGGVKVALGGKVYDGSLRGRLQNLAKILQGGSE